MTSVAKHVSPWRPGPPAAFAKALQVGTPQTHKGLAVVPLAFAGDRGPRYLTLAQALSAGSFHVTEVSEGGSVPALRAINEGPLGVLLLDGEELVGAKQNRVLNTAVFVPAKSRLDVPVSCVEAGRWRYSSREFHDEEFVVHATVRRAVHESVSVSLNAAGAHRSDQGLVWDEVAGLQRFAEEPSHTGAHRDVYTQRAHDIAGYLGAFPLQRGQHGLLVLRDGDVVGLDFVSRASCYAQLHSKLVRSYAFEAVTRRMGRVHAGGALKVDSEAGVQGHGGARGKRGRGSHAERALAAAQSFLAAIADLPARSFRSPGRGHDVRYSSDGLSGSALVVGGVALHGAFFAAERDRSDGARGWSLADGRMAGFERRRANRGPRV